MRMQRQAEHSTRPLQDQRTRFQECRQRYRRFMRHWYTASDENRPERWLRILLRSREQLKAEDKVQLIAEVQSAIDRFQASNVEQANEDNRPPLLTGYYVILTRLVSHLLADQWSSFVLASIGILLCVRLAWALGSWRCWRRAKRIADHDGIGWRWLSGDADQSRRCDDCRRECGFDDRWVDSLLVAYQKSRREGAVYIARCKVLSGPRVCQ